MVCSGGFDEMGKQMAADYCIPEKNGDWYVIISDDCLNLPLKNSFLRFYSPAHCPVQCAKGTVLILTYIQGCRP